MAQEDPEEKALDALLDRVKEHAEFDRARIAAMQQRAAWMLALAGVIFGLGATQARETLNQAPNLGADGEDIAAASLALGLFFVMLSAISALVAVLPKTTWVLDEESRDKLYEQRDGWSAKEIKRQHADFLFTRLSHDTAGFKTLRWGVRGAFWFMVAGIVCLAVHVGVYAERTWTCEHPSSGGATTNAPADYAFLHKRKSPTVYGDGGCGGTGKAEAPSAADVVTAPLHR